MWKIISPILQYIFLCSSPTIALGDMKEAFSHGFYPVLTCVLIFRAGGWGVVQTPLHGMPGDKAEWHQPRGAWPTGSRRAAGTEWWVSTYFSTVSGGPTLEWSLEMSENIHALKSLFKDMTAGYKQIPVKVTHPKEWAEGAGNDGWVIKMNEDTQFGDYRSKMNQGRGGEGSEYIQNTIYGILRELLKILKKENKFINRLFRNF